MAEKLFKSSRQDLLKPIFNSVDLSSKNTCQINMLPYNFKYFIEPDIIFVNDQTQFDTALLIWCHFNFLAELKLTFYTALTNPGFCHVFPLQKDMKIFNN